ALVGPAKRSGSTLRADSKRRIVMNYWSLGLVPGLLAVGALVSAENPGRQEKSDTLASGLLSLAELQQPQRPSQRQIYEDIEIYRRLLGKSLLRFVHGAEGVNLAWQRYTGNTYPAQGDYGRAQSSTPNASTYLGLFSLTANPHQGIPAAPLSIEGVYLQARGIVISAELPIKYTASVKKPTPAPKKWSDWEREKRALNGEKIDKPEDTKSRRAPDLLETVLRSLAENGHHLSGLQQDQHVTLSLTFRTGAAQLCISCHTVSSV